MFVSSGYMWAGADWRLRVERRFQLQSANRDPIEVSTKLFLRRIGQDQQLHSVSHDVSPAVAVDVLAACEGRLFKNEYTVEEFGYSWKIALYRVINDGLAIAEVRLPAEIARPPRLPVWCGEEITYDKRYLEPELARKAVQRANGG